MLQSWLILGGMQLNGLVGWDGLWGRSVVDEVKLQLELCGVGFLQVRTSFSFYHGTIIHTYLFILLEVDTHRGKSKVFTVGVLLFFRHNYLSTIKTGL